jgi:hypothetical protein
LSESNSESKTGDNGDDKDSNSNDNNSNNNDDNNNNHNNNSNNNDNKENENNKKINEKWLRSKKYFTTYIARRKIFSNTIIWTLVLFMASVAWLNLLTRITMINFLFKFIILWVVSTHVTYFIYNFIKLSPYLPKDRMELGKNLVNLRVRVRLKVRDRGLGQG